MNDDNVFNALDPFGVGGLPTGAGLLDALPPSTEVVFIPPPTDFQPRPLSPLDISRRKPAPTTIVTLKALAGHVALWAVRQSPYDFPEGLQAALATFRERAAVDFQDFHGVRMREVTAKELRELLGRHLLDIPEVEAWNVPRSGHGRQVVFSSAFDGPAPDDDFIDLDALVHNAAHSAFVESLLDDGAALVRSP